MKNVMEFEKVNYSYNAIPALRDFSYSFEMGKIYVIDGPNGSGKSTLFRIMTGLSFPDSGTYRFFGDEITEKYMKDKKKAFDFHRRQGFLFQNTELQLFTGSVEDEVLFGVSQLGLPMEEAKKRVEKYLEMFDIAELRERVPYNLSGGEKKRVALASIFAMEPEVVILDEPLSGLDEESQEAMKSFLRELKASDKLIIIATHHKELAAEMADERLSLNREHKIIEH